MGEFLLSEILDGAFEDPPSKALKVAPPRQSFDYQSATSKTLQDAVQHVKVVFQGPLGKALSHVRALADEVDVFVERIVAGKLSHLKPKDIKTWFTRGVVKQPDGRPLRMSQLHALARGINAVFGQLERLEERQRNLEVGHVMEERTTNERIERALERADTRKEELEERLKRLTEEFLNSLSSIAMLVAQE
jgi:hypothetical protein